MQNSVDEKQRFDQYLKTVAQQTDSLDRNKNRMEKLSAVSFKIMIALVKNPN